MTKITNGHGMSVPPSQLQNAENVRSNSVADKGNVDVQDRNKTGAGSNPVSPEMQAAKVSEGNMQATALAAELNSRLNAQRKDLPPVDGKAGHEEEAEIHGFKAQNVNSFMENALISGLTDPKEPKDN